MRWKLIVKRLRTGTGGGELTPYMVNFNMVQFRHDSKIPFRTLHDAAAIEFIKRVVLNDEI